MLSTLVILLVKRILKMRFVTAALVALLLSAGTANAEEHVLAINPGGPYSVTPGGEIARINKQRPLPNAFGAADIFGRKVESGSIQFIYFGSGRQRTSHDPPSRHRGVLNCDNHEPHTWLRPWTGVVERSGMGHILERHGQR